MCDKEPRVPFKIAVCMPKSCSENVRNYLQRSSDKSHTMLRFSGNRHYFQLDRKGRKGLVHGLLGYLQKGQRRDWHLHMDLSVLDFYLNSIECVKIIHESDCRSLSLLQCSRLRSWQILSERTQRHRTTKYLFAFFKELELQVFRLCCLFQSTQTARKWWIQPFQNKDISNHSTVFGFCQWYGLPLDMSSTFP